jgi:hypothetical protein
MQPDEMTVACGAATLVADLAAALAEAGQGVSLPMTGTVGDFTIDWYGELNKNRSIVIVRDVH